MLKPEDFARVKPGFFAPKGARFAGKAKGFLETADLINELGLSYPYPSIYIPPEFAENFLERNRVLPGVKRDAAAPARFDDGELELLEWVYSKYEKFWETNPPRFNGPLAIRGAIEGEDSLESRLPGVGKTEFSWEQYGGVHPVDFLNAVGRVILSGSDLAICRIAEEHGISPIPGLLIQPVIGQVHRNPYAQDGLWFAPLYSGQLNTARRDIAKLSVVKNSMGTAIVADTLRPAPTFTYDRRDGAPSSGRGVQMESDVIVQGMRSLYRELLDQDQIEPHAIPKELVRRIFEDGFALEKLVGYGSEHGTHIEFATEFFDEPNPWPLQVLQVAPIRKFSSPVEIPSDAPKLSGELCVGSADRAYSHAYVLPIYFNKEDLEAEQEAVLLGEYDRTHDGYLLVAPDSFLYILNAERLRGCFTHAGGVLCFADERHRRSADTHWLEGYRDRKIQFASVVAEYPELVQLGIPDGIWTSRKGRGVSLEPPVRIVTDEDAEKVWIGQVQS